MKNQFNLNIKTPCTKNFNTFIKTTNGGFCNSCKKEVIDFTTMTSQEITTYFKNKNNTNTCGRFNNNQLKTYPRKTNSLKSFVSGIGLACLSLFTFNNIQAQESKNNTTKVKASKTQEEILVKGTVIENNIPLPGVNIILQGTAIGTTTNFDGNFEFPEKLKKGDVLVFSFVGMTSQKIIIDNKKSESKIDIKVNMKADSCIIMGKVASKEIYSSKKK